MGAHNSVVGADQGFRAPSLDLMCRILYRFLALLARLAVRCGRSKDLEIIVLRHPIDITNREVLYGGITANPTDAWTTHAARNLFMRHPNRFTHTRARLRDRASQFVNDFDEVFCSEGLKIVKTPVHAPVANAFAERWIGTLRRELLDRTIIWNRRKLERLVVDYIDHYNMRV